MRLSRIIGFYFIMVITWGGMAGMLQAAEFRIAVVQGDNGYVQAYEPLVAHLAKMGVAVTLVTAPTHQAVATLFASGKVDAMFSGSGIPGSMIVIDRLKGKWFSAGFKGRDSRIQQAMTGSATRSPSL